MAYNPFRHFGLKAAAVGIATLLWIAVGGEKIVERSMSAPLELQNVPSSLELVGASPSDIDVRLRGSSSALARLDLGDVKAVLDVGSAKPGRNLFHLSPDQVTSPFGVEVNYVGPATVPLTFERQLTKRVPVIPQVEGEPAPGYETGAVSVEPATVEVEGPESALRDLDQATTEPVDLKASMTPVRVTVTIGILNSVARLRAPQNAVVTVDIRPVGTERTIQAVPVHLEQLASGRRAQAVPANVSVTVRGGDDALKKVGPGSIEVEVDLSGMGPGRYTLPVRVAPSRLFGVVRVEPAKVQVTIR